MGIREVSASSLPSVPTWCSICAAPCSFSALYTTQHIKTAIGNQVWQSDRTRFRTLYTPTPPLGASNLIKESISTTVNAYNLGVSQLSVSAADLMRSALKASQNTATGSAQHELRLLALRSQCGGGCIATLARNCCVFLHHSCKVTKLHRWLQRYNNMVGWWAQQCTVSVPIRIGPQFCELRPRQRLRVDQISSAPEQGHVLCRRSCNQQCVRVVDCDMPCCASVSL